MSEQTAPGPTRVVGLAYEPGGDLPQVVLKGVGTVADEIVRRSRYGGGPPVIRDQELLDRLFRLPVDSAITPDLFQVVAIVLAHILVVNRHLKGETR
jgi:type III secretion system FlhB-like substrate exporter